MSEFIEGIDEIIHIRVDDRMLHGQVVTFWSNSLQVSRIIVANDDVAVDDMRKTVLRMAAPAGVKTSLIGVERAAKQIAEGRYAGQRVLLITDGPHDIVRMLDAGLPIKKVNVGNMAPNDENAIHVKKSVSLTAAQIADFRTLVDRGVEVTSQMVPADPMSHLSDFVDELK